MKKLNKLLNGKNGLKSTQTLTNNKNGKNELKSDINNSQSIEPKEIIIIASNIGENSDINNNNESKDNNEIKTNFSQLFGTSYHEYQEKIRDIPSEIITYSNLFSHSISSYEFFKNDLESFLKDFNFTININEESLNDINILEIENLLNDKGFEPINTYLEKIENKVLKDNENLIENFKKLNEFSRKIKEKFKKRK